MPLERLDKIIASQSEMSRSQVRTAIQRGKVAVDGRIIKDSSAKLDPDSAVIEINGQRLSYERFVYVMLNKPAGVLSASRDPKTQTVADLVEPQLRSRNLFPAGRLDKDSVGLIILTDDGDYCHRILSPKKEIYKTYFVRLNGVLPQGAYAEFEQGITLEDGTKCLPARLFCAPEGEDCARVQICEGKFHQVKRMFAAIGLTVTHLKRERIGGLALDGGLREGEYRRMTGDEARLVFLPDKQVDE